MRRCGICYRFYKNNLALGVHKRKTHGIKGKTIKERKMTKAEIKIQRFMRILFGERKCNYCGKSVTRHDLHYNRDRVFCNHLCFKRFRLGLSLENCKEVKTVKPIKPKISEPLLLTIQTR